MFRLIVLLFPFAAVAAEPASAPVVSFGTYVQAALALGLIVALLIGSAWLARKVSGGKGFGQGHMKVIGGVALGPRERIVLLEIGEEWLVVGIVPGQIRTLHRLAKGHGLPGDEVPQPAGAAFSDWLQRVSEKRKHD